MAKWDIMCALVISVILFVLLRLKWDGTSRVTSY